MDRDILPSLGAEIGAIACASIGWMPLLRRSAAACLSITLFTAAVVMLDRHAWRSIAAESQPGSAAQSEEEQARVVCGVCHAFPPPDILPRGTWRDEFVRMKFIREGRLPPVGPPSKVYAAVQLPPDMERVLPFYTSRAPERLPRPESWPDPAESPVKFVRHALSVPDMPGTPAVSNVRLVDMDGDKRLDLLGTDMRQGVVFTGHPAIPGSALTTIAIHIRHR